MKQYLTRKEWKMGEQSCSLVELQKKAHRTKKGLRERKKKRSKRHLGIGKKYCNTTILLSIITRKLSYQAGISSLLSPTSLLSPLLDDKLADFYILIDVSFTVQSYPSSYRRTQHTHSMLPSFPVHPRMDFSS